MKLKIAIGTDNGKEFTNKHFGDSKYFFIYEFIEANRINLIEKRENIKFNEEKHGDTKKAAHISNQLKDVSVLMARVFGPNIVKIRKKFVPIIARYNLIEDALNKLPEVAEQIEKNLKKETDKEIIYIKG